MPDFITTCFRIFQPQEMPDNLRRLSRKSDSQNILLPQKCIILISSINIRIQKPLPLVSFERKQKDTVQCMVQESIYAAAKAVNDDRILRLCENYDFLQQKQGVTKNVMYST